MQSGALGQLALGQYAAADADVSITPSPVAVSLVIPAPTLTFTGLVTPSPITIPISIPVPTVSLGALTISPAPVAILLALPAPSISSSQNFLINIELVQGAGTSTTLDTNIELVQGSAASDTENINIELVNGTPVSVVFTINLEVLEDAAQAGQPETILQVVGPANRLRAELFDWQVNLRGVTKFTNADILGSSHVGIQKLNYVDEFLGPKVGIGPILDLIDLQYDWRLDQIGQWEATIAGLSPNLQPALDGTAKIIKFHFEGIGIILIGWIAEHEVDDSGALKLRGYDPAVFLGRRSSFYRHHIRRAFGPSMYKWAAGLLLPATYDLEFGPNSGGDRKGDPSPTVESFPNYFIDRRFQSQTIVDMWQEMGYYWGNHWRINPVGFQVYIDPMGTDSGKVVSVVGENDPKALEEGVIAIRSLTYRKSDEELYNSLLPQGSNNAFGVAVELRHTRQQRKFGYYSDIPFIDLSFPQLGRVDELASVEDNISVFDDETGTVSHTLTEDYQLSSELGVGASTGAAPYSKVYLAYADRVTFSAEFDFAWAAAFGFAQIYGGSETQQPIGDLRFDLCPDVGDEPDTNNPVVSLGLGNYGDMSEMPEVNNGFEDRPTNNPTTGAFVSGGDKVNFCEAIWIPDQVQGFRRIPAGSYWAVISRVIGFNRNDPWDPDIQASGISTWVAATRITQAPQHAPGNSSLWYTSGGVWEGQGLQPLIEISGRYNTASDIRDYPYIVMAQFAAGIDDTLATSGRRIMYIRDNASIQEWGLREKVVTFQGAVDSRQGVQDVAPAADVLYGSAVTWMNRHKQRFEFLSFDAIGYFDLPPPGEKVRVVFRGLADVDEKRRVWVDINDDYWVIGITTHIAEGGVSHTFDVANIPENLLDPNAIPYEIMRANARHNNYLAELEYGTHVGIVRDDF